MTARIAPLSPPYTPDVEAMLRKWMPPNSGLEPLALFRTIVRHGTLSDRMRPLGSAILGHGTLPPRVRELLILRTCARTGAEYAWGVHVTAFSGAVGLDEAAVRRTCADPESLRAADDDDALVLRFADELHDASTVGDAVWTALASRFSPEQLLELTAVVGFYHLISFVANAARVEHEPWAARFPA